jgi:hypothetical protein
MLSITSLLSCAAITLLTSSQLSAASPVPVCPISKVGVISLPTTGTGTQLPDPSTGLNLQFVTLGRGVQNYSCASASAAPVAVGAIASLFDITAFANASSTSPQFTTLPASAAYLTLPRVQALLDTRMPCGCKASVIGKHYFSAAGVPIFDLSVKGMELISKKLDSVPAPSSANVGPAGTGAVPWLKLDDAGGSVGLKEVYRVYTAGGNPYTTCSGQKLGPGGVFTVEYSAMYWFYG